MSFASDLLPTLDDIRGIAGEMGLHPYDVLVRVVTWDDGVPGEGTRTAVDTTLLVNGQRPKVEQLSDQDAMLSGGVYTNQDFRIGPLTPPFVGGGVAYATLDPAVSPGVEVHFQLTGPGLPTVGSWFKRVRDDTDSALHTYLIVRATGVQNP